MLPSKKDIKAFCLVSLEDMIIEFSASIKEIQLGMFEETKSSVGDKFETTRTQYQREIERLTIQLANSHTTKIRILSMGDSESIAVGEGSLIQLKSGANSLMIYLAAAMGTLIFNGHPLHVISIQSPLGTALMGKKKGDSFKFNAINYSIEELQ